MYVKIGPYKDWIGPYQIADLLQHVGVSEHNCFTIGTWLAEKTPLSNICEWIDSKRKRKIKVHIDKYDTWNLDVTLAIIVLPMLKQLNEKKRDGPFVDDADVPDELKSTSAPPKENDYDIDDNWFKRWHWVMAEMIWAFEQMQPDSNWEDKYIITPAGLDFSNYVEGVYDCDGMDKHQKRINNGLLLFGKYFRGLWD